jgi:hypothetical protein
MSWRTNRDLCLPLPHRHHAPAERNHDTSITSRKSLASIHWAHIIGLKAGMPPRDICHRGRGGSNQREALGEGTIHECSNVRLPDSPCPEPDSSASPRHRATCRPNFRHVRLASLVTTSRCLLTHRMATRTEAAVVAAGPASARDRAWDRRPIPPDPPAIARCSRRLRETHLRTQGTRGASVKATPSVCKEKSRTSDSG